jgi:hypothetical protein
MGQFTPQTADFVGYHYKFVVLYRDTPRRLFYSFFNFRQEKVEEMSSLPLSSTSGPLADYLL